MSGDETTGTMVEGEDTSLLIVDDDKPFLTRLARAMETRGFVVETAESVEEAVAKALRLRAWSWQDIEVLEGPQLVLHGDLAGHDVDISLTHSKGMAGAVAVVRARVAEAAAQPR